jgi:hypothetical protein
MKTKNVEFQNFSCLTETQFNDLVKNNDELNERCFDNHDELHFQMIDLIHKSLETNVNFDDELYYDIETNIDEKSFTLKSIHESTYGTYSIILHKKLNVPELPITLKLPELFDKIINNDL